MHTNRLKLLAQSLIPFGIHDRRKNQRPLWTDDLLGEV
jgi:hypothetical protein